MLPETMEKLSHGEPTFFVNKKVYAMFSNNHHNDGHIAVLLPVPLGVQPALIKAAPKKFYNPPYVGVRGWVGIELPFVSDEELAFHLQEAWRLIAPKKLQDRVEALARKTDLSAKESSEQKYFIPTGVKIRTDKGLT